MLRKRHRPIPLAPAEYDCAKGAAGVKVGGGAVGACPGPPKGGCPGGPGGLPGGLPGGNGPPPGEGPLPGGLGKFLPGESKSSKSSKGSLYIICPYLLSVLLPNTV